MARASVNLEPHDPFDLIRLLARTQSDPRKAVAELVQNSLDAGARNIRITWFTHEGHRAIAVLDDGRGVFPEIERDQALTRIATTIGHSHKKKLSPAERMEALTLGKYGIGLLGFWSVGRFMEIRTRVGGGDVWALSLEEDRREAELTKKRSSRLQLEDTYTEVIITFIHRGVEAQLKPRRLAAYLAGELRGQLLSRDVALEIHDRVGRGRAQKRLVVRPQRYQGVPLEDLRELPVEGHASARVELYLLPPGDDRHGHTQLACGGTTVLDDLALLDGVDAPREPWSSGRIEGVIDFPDLEVSPGTRRGFVPNEAAFALLAALARIEADLKQRLAEEDERRAIERQADDARDIRRAFKRLLRTLPQYTLLDTTDRERKEVPASGPEGATGDEVPEADAADLPDDGSSSVDPPGYLFPPGPLCEVRVSPRKSVLPPEGERTLRAVALDADRRPLEEPVRFEWRLDGPGDLATEGAVARYRASAEVGAASVCVTARADGREAEGAAEISVRDDLGAGDQGVPDPVPIDAPGESWRSRVLDGVWQYNAAHPDYRAVCGDPRRRVRYLAHCFAKEIVLRNFGGPQDGPLLERLVEVITHLDDPPRGKRGGGGAGRG